MTRSRGGRRVGKRWQAAGESTLRYLTTSFLALLSALFISGNAEAGECRVKGIRLQGRVQVVTAFPDLKVQVIKAFPDLEVQLVDSFPDKCGEWQMVKSFPDFTIQFVTAFPDLKIQYVTTFPGEG